MDKRALFLVPVVMALLGLLLVWLGWVPGGSPGAPTDTRRPRPAETTATDGSTPDDQPTRRRERVHAADAAARSGEETGEEQSAEARRDAQDGDADDMAFDPVTINSPLGYASAYVGQHRDEVHREEMKIVWPDMAPEEGPPPGAEVLLIKGYDSYTATRFAWNGRGATGARVAIRSRRRGGKRIASHGFDVSRADFERAWNAARLIEGARAERKEPPPESDEIGGRMSIGSHSPHYWVRVRSVLDDEPLHESVTRSRSFSRGIRSWREIQNRALYDMLAALVPEEPADAPLEPWRDPMTSELEGASPVSGTPDEPTRVLLTVALAVVGETGGRDALAALADLEESLAKGARGSFYAKLLHEGCSLARAKIQLRLDWTVDAAVRVIREGPREHRWQQELVLWTRDRLRASDASLYGEVLREDLRERLDDADLMRETIAELRLHYAGELGSILEPALASPVPEVCVATALALLDAVPHAPNAIAALDAIASDTSLHAPTWETFQKTPRARAVRRLIDDGGWDTVRMREQFAAAGENGHMLHRLDLALTQAGAALSDLERREGYRRALEGRPDRGLIKAMERLVELDDAPSFDRIDALLTRHATAPPEGEEDLLDRWARERLIPKLREDLAKARAR